MSMKVMKTTIIIFSLTGISNYSENILTKHIFSAIIKHGHKQAHNNPNGSFSNNFHTSNDRQLRQKKQGVFLFFPNHPLELNNKRMLFLNYLIHQEPLCFAR